MQGPASALVAALVAAWLGSGAALAAADMPTGKVSGLPVPRYVSLKTDRVNLREGPSKDHRTAWIFQRAGLPVEITGEFETWRRIRDAEGTEGWVLHSLLSGRRTALVMPWAKPATAALPLYEKADEKTGWWRSCSPTLSPASRAAQAAGAASSSVLPGARDLSGYMKQERLWGVYPNEKVE
jgi:SH3-like domain-containing protein